MPSGGPEVSRAPFDEVEPGPVVYRDEALGLMLAVHDILEEVRAIREFLEDGDGEEEEEQAD
jgi:hypothetical protein